MTVPNPEEFIHATEARAWNMVAFARAASGISKQLTVEEQDLIHVGIVTGMTCAVEELQARGLLNNGT